MKLEKKERRPFCEASLAYVSNVFKAQKNSTLHA